MIVAFVTGGGAGRRGGGGATAGPPTRVPSHDWKVVESFVRQRPVNLAPSALRVNSITPCREHSKYVPVSTAPSSVPSTVAAQPK